MVAQWSLLTAEVIWKPRVINTTDLGADPDDEQSMVRQLVCANEFDLEGLIVTTGLLEEGAGEHDEARQDRERLCRGRDESSGAC